jgi:hypothetical protein
VATLAANVAHGLIGAAVAARPTVALVGSYELRIIMIRGSQVPGDGAPGTGRDADPLITRTKPPSSRRCAF